ncbi:MAG: hypothetical protein CR988_03910 [Treponema sp.]|nr:MAG: hypothetical protein CR988_03910 [Treponema sp.]
MKPTLLVLAAGMGSRFGGLKQIQPVGLNGETLLDFGVYDAFKSGFGKVVFVIRKDIEDDFRDVIFNRIAKHCNAEYVFQKMTSFLTDEQVQKIQNRKKPWGTVHAVLCSQKSINEPFAVINADDYYGRSAYKTMADYLSGVSNNSIIHAMVGYILENTLSRSGSVSRGVCKVADDYLLSMKENKNIMYEMQNGVEKIVSEFDGQKRVLTGKEVTSMNLFGFSPKIFDVLKEFFFEFIERSLESEKDESLLPEAANLIVQKAIGKFKVFTTEEQWFGMTYKEDYEIVKKEIAKKISEGYYPENLWP